jgi:hypothetical protein
MSDIAVTGALGTLAAGRRRQRFALAADLCAGRCVALLGASTDDPDCAPLVEVARKVIGVQSLPDADPAAVPEALVWVDGPAEFAAMEAQSGALQALSKAGVRLLLAVPNALAGEPVGRPTARGVDTRAARSLATHLDGRLLLQHALELAVLGLDGEPLEVSVCLTLQDSRGEDAGHLLLAVGFDDEELAAALRTTAVGARPVQAAYLAALTSANADLRAANALLARRNLGLHDAAAAAKVSGWQSRLAEAVAARDQAEQRLEVEKEVAFANDRLYQAARRQLEAPRYRAVDTVRNALIRIPIAGSALRGVWRLMHRLTRQRPPDNSSRR